MKRTMISLALVVLFASCKKENDEQPFSAPGLWEGNIYLYNTTLLLRANGTTRLFMGTSNGDTSQCANPPINGTYTVNGGTFRAEYGDPNGIDVMILKAENVSGITMKGAMTNSSGVYTDFQFAKKQ
jgi:hypothetical protein